MSRDLFDPPREPRPSVQPAGTRTEPSPTLAVSDLHGPRGGHYCVVCGGPAGFGFGVFLRQGKPGRWGCFDHREQVEAMA